MKSLGLPSCAVLVVASIASACGGKTELLFAVGDATIDTLVATDVGPDTSDPDVEFVSDAPVSACRWRVGATTALTIPPDDHEASSAIHVVGGALVATFSSDDPANDHAWSATLLNESGTTAGAPVTIFGDRPNSLSVGGMAIGNGFGHRGATVWDAAHGCRFASLDPVTSAPSGAVTLSRSYCGGLHATADGFRYIESDLAPGFTHVPVTIDVHGGARNAGDPIAPVTDQAYWLSVVSTSSDETIAAWIADSRSPVQVVGRILSEQTSFDGPTIGAGNDGRWIRLTATPQGAIVTWLEAIGSSENASVRFATLDRSAHTFGPARDVATAKAFRDAGISVGSAHGDVMVAWMETGDATSTRAQHLYVQPLAPDGTARGARLTVSDFFVGSDPRLVATSTGALLIYEAEPMASRMQVFATALDCPP